MPSARTIAAEGHAGRAQRYSPRPLTAGERWTVEALAELRRRRHRPGAWVAFLRSSLQRSRTARSQRPELARQAAAWGMAGAAAWSAACVAARRRELDPPALAGLAWWLAVWRMLDWHLGMAEAGDGRPRARLSAADAVTLTRFWLVPALPPAARERDHRAMLPAVIVLGGMTDWLDGSLARRNGRTRLGRDLDSTADLAFLSAAALSAHRAGRLSRLGRAALLTRHAIGFGIALGAVFGRSRRPAIRARPSGAAMRVAGLALSTADRPRTGTSLLVLGCLVPPRSTSPSLSPA
jgi:phosphatidylglycerophosphate synthase